MKKFFIKLLAVIAGISLITGLLCAVICIQAGSLNFYVKEYKKLGVAEVIGVSDQDLKTATEVLMDYTKGTREDMIVEADFGGEVREFYNDREKAHMIDVRNLFAGAKKLAIVGVLTGAVLLSLLLIFVKKDRSAVLQGYRIGNYLFLGIFAGVALYAAVDFTAFWTTFHHVFFTNDLYLLDPNTSNLINMVPEKFFFDLVFRIVAWFVGIGAALFAASSIWDRKLLKKGGEGNVS